MKQVSGHGKWFHVEKGYGFIWQEEVGDAFVHHRQIVQEGYRFLQEKDAVTYVLKKGQKDGMLKT